MSTGGEWIGKACALGKPIGLMQGATKKVNFVIATTGSTGSSKELFTIGGTVGVVAFGVCDSDLNAPSGTATLSLGTANAVEHFISGTTATTIDTTEIWGPVLAAKEGLYSGVASSYSIVKDTDIGYTVGTATINSGSMTFYALWTPITDGAWLEVQETDNSVL